MRNSIAITPLRDSLPAQRLLLLAIIAALISALPGLAHGKTRGKLTRTTYPVSRPAPPVKPVATPAAVATVSLRAANDGVAPKTVVEPGLIGGLTVGRSSNASADAVGGPVSPALPKSGATTWYPESHSYLRPYHYKWRYGTPG